MFARLALLILLIPIAGAAQDQPLVVATKHAPPFSIEKEDGSWSGISIELWERIAGELGLQYELRRMEQVEPLLAAVESGQADLAVAAFTVTAERERRLDFTHPFHTTGLGIAVQARQTTTLLSLFKRLFSYDLLRILLGFSLLLLVIGVLVWLCERKRNPEQFGNGVLQGLGSGFWWSAVTMTTVGYGDKAPVTFWGRLIALCWMFAGIILISSFTAAIATALTVNQLEAQVSSPDDLSKVRVATATGTTSEAYLQQRRLPYAGFPRLQDALMALDRKEVDAVVYDAPMLRYLITTEFAGRLRALPVTFERQDYAIVLPADSPLREPLNRVLLDQLSDQGWQDILYRYLGN